jgi:cytochrome-b5 reductase
MVAGGTGITPMYQIAKQILGDPEDSTKIYLLFANVSIRDILLKNELEEMMRSHPEQFYVHFVVDEAPEGWTGSVGYVTAAMIQQHCPEPSSESMLLFCGPRSMTKALQNLASELGYLKDQTFAF